jgi:site-specific DNA-cytosine methylase
MKYASASNSVVLKSGNTTADTKAYLVDGTGNSYGATVTVVDGTNPANTVKASSGKKASRATTPSGRVVRMTPRALARFQTVPDDYALPEKNTLACKVIGNGVPCLMMQRIMEAF